MDEKLDGCPRCAGCGQIADDDDGTPWKYWAEMPVQNAIAVIYGIVKPLECPLCHGTGKVVGVSKDAQITNLREQLAATQERERVLREALEEIARSPHRRTPESWERETDKEFWDGVERMAQIARQVLKETEAKP